MERHRDSKPRRKSGWKAGGPPPRGAPGLFEGRRTEERSGQWPLGRSASLGLSDPQLSAGATACRVPAPLGALNQRRPQPFGPPILEIQLPMRLWPRKHCRSVPLSLRVPICVYFLCLRDCEPRRAPQIPSRSREIHLSFLSSELTRTLNRSII